MAEGYNNPKSYREWGDALDKAERENKIPEWIKFARRSYEREAEHAFYCDPDLPVEPFASYEEWRAAKRRYGDLTIKMTWREDIDAYTNLSNSKWHDVDIRTGGHGPKQARVTLRRLKRAPAKYVRGPDGVKIPRSKSYVPC